MTEHELQEEVFGLCRRLDLWVMYSPDSKRVHELKLGAGKPDLLIWGPRELMAVELKTEGGQLSSDQRKWKYRIERAGIGYRTWRPFNHDHHHIEVELRRLAG